MVSGLVHNIKSKLEKNISEKKEEVDMSLCADRTRAFQGKNRASQPFYYSGAFYDRGSTFPLKYFLNGGVFLTQNCRNAVPVSKNDLFV